MTHRLKIQTWVIVKGFFYIFARVAFFAVEAKGATAAPATETIDFTARHVRNITHAELNFRVPLPLVTRQERARALLVLFPGCNGDGCRTYFAPDSCWLNFGDASGVVLAAAHFASPESDLESERGYYQASQGSGLLLNEMIASWERENPVQRNLPLYLFGFSGGAHFVHRFALWQPDRVAGFVAYSAGWWSVPDEAVARRRALIVCGYLDERFDATLSFFKQGRLLNAPWCFARVRHTAHEVTPSALQLCQDWLTAAMSAHSATSAREQWSGHLYTNAIWPNSAPPSPAPRADATVCFPNENFANSWRNFNLIQDGHEPEIPP